MARNGTHILSDLPRGPGARPRGAGGRALPAIDSKTLRRQNAVAWGFILVLLAVQFGLWRQFCLREVTWAYPSNFDQLAYLEQSYQTYDRILQHGLVTGLEEGMGMKFGHLPMNAAGATLHLQAALLYLVAGPSRLAALSLNFIYWAAFQLALVGTLRWLTGRWGATFLGLGLLLTLISPFFPTGGSLFDFRLDFIAFCLFGIFICAVIRSNLFADWRWSAAVGAVGAVLGTFRFITLAYVLGIFVVFAACLAVQWVARWRDLPGQRIVQRRIFGMLVAGAVIALLVAPVLWHHREAIRSYYGLHVSGQEKSLRAEQSGTTTLAADVRFYWTSLSRDHVGNGFWIVSGIVLALAIAAATIRGPAGEQSPESLDVPAAVAFLAACVLVPYLILTRDDAKSPIVGDVMAPPIVWLVLLAVLLLLGAARRGTLWPVARNVMWSAAGLAMLAAIYQQFSEYSRQSLLGHYRPETEKVDAMWDRMADDCQLLGWKSPAIAPDAMLDFLTPKVLTILDYEKHGVLLDAGSAIGRLEAYDAKELYDRLAMSDFAIITRNTGPATFEFPFDRQMRQWHGDILKWCRQNMVELEHDQLGMPFDRDVTVFIRPAVGMRAAADGWVTGDGMDLTALARALRKFPVVELRGSADFSLLHDKTPRASATLESPGGKSIALPADFVRSGSAYVMTIRTNPADLPASGPVTIHVNFDESFVPAQIGANADTRELVMKLPQTGILRPAPREN